MEPKMLGARAGPLRLTSLNHISLVCRSLEKTLDFYCNVLGFFPIRRPESFDFDGAWLFNYGIGIHLLQSEVPEGLPPKKKREIDPKDSHISFHCMSMASAAAGLEAMGITYIHRRFEEGGVYVDQLFFHDPDGFMIEICNCDDLPTIPVATGELGAAGEGMMSIMAQQLMLQFQQPDVHVKEGSHCPCA